MPDKETMTQQTLGGKPVTALVNQKRTDDFDVDIGRANGGQSHLQNTDPGDPGWLGNPFTLSEYDRDESIEKYREVFDERIKTDDEFRQAVEDLRGKTLGCYCRPKPCHGDVILEFLRGGL